MDQLEKEDQKICWRFIITDPLIALAAPTFFESLQLGFLTLIMQNKFMLYTEKSSLIPK
jgi:hypothetical protein